ncbi:MAG TPA: APC family permease [Gemmatimonadaceae bacterium]|nr:APC family permease [Gemmatimonadaceae bacterium]
MSVPDTAQAPALVRALGRWDLVALVINGIVGAGIFGLPARVHALIGMWGIIAIVACALLVATVVLCFAEVSSRFRDTGGPYLYTAEAFGPLPAFIVGWLLWLARVAGICAIAGILVEYVGLLVPGVERGVPRAIFLTVIIGGFTALHVSGVARSIRVGNVITVAKLVPLLLLAGVGLATIDMSTFALPAWRELPLPSRGDFSSAVLLLTFAFVGWETAVVAAGETRDPGRDMPFALLIGLGAVVMLYAALQAVCIGLLPALATSSRPLADAASALIGPVGGTIIVLGAAVSMLGTINGGMLTISRIPLAMADAGQLPAFLRRLHPTTSAPVPSILLSAVAVWVLALTSTHVYVLTISTIARLLVFAVTCAALPVLRRRNTPAPARFRVAGGLTIPVLSLLMIAWLLSGTSITETRDVVLAAVAGGVLHAVVQGTSQRRRGA